MTPNLKNKAEVLLALFLAERERWVLWLPVLVGTGVAVYFRLPFEPSLWFGSLMLLAAGCLSVLMRKRPVFLITAIAVMGVSLGFAAAQLRTAYVAAPVLQKSFGPGSVEGRIDEIETRPRGLRVTLESPRIFGVGPAITPERVRVTLNGKQPELVPGDWIRVRAKLTSPPPPSAPGAFDFQRRAYFRGIGAVGFAFGPAQITDKTDHQDHFIAQSRHGIGARVLRYFESHDNPIVGGVVVALMTGQRGSIPPQVMDAFRDSGIAHLLAISGLHIGLIAGFVFFGVRALLALVPPLALRYPIKKWAAVVAIICAFAYAMIAGATIPTLRAFLMIGVVLFAILIERRGISMRLVAFAATVLLLMQPESLLGASFQLSFAAVTALIATYEYISRRRRTLGNVRARGWPPRVVLYLGGVALTTVVAAAVTAPFAAFHFNRFADYGLAANLLAVPVTALWIMPWAVAAFALMPFGLEALALTPMGWGVEFVIAVSTKVAAWPGAVTLIPVMPDWGLGFVVFGGLWLCLWKKSWRLFGIAGPIIGMASLLTVQTPDLLIDAKAKLVAIKGTDGQLSLSTSRASAFTRDMWLRRAAQASAKAWPDDGLGPLKCDSLGCLYTNKGRTVALVQDFAALQDDCQVADAVISTVPVRGRCSGPKLVIDRFDLWRNGAHAVWFEKDGFRVESVNRVRGDRPWVPKPRKGGT